MLERIYRMLFGSEKDQAKVPIDRATQFADELIRHGYLKFAPAEDHEELRQQLIERISTSGFVDTDWDDRCDSRDRRTYQADNEDLAEGAVGDLLERMSPVLKREGCAVEPIVDHSHSDDFEMDGKYVVDVGGRSHIILSRTDPHDESWRLALVRTITIINDLLERAGSGERCYAINGGNDGHVTLLTNELFQMIRQEFGTRGVRFDHPHRLEEIP